MIIKTQIDSGLSVLVVCGAAAGRQRSAAVVASYIAMYVLNSDNADRLEDAITHTMMKRSTAFRILDKYMVMQKVHWFDAMQLAVASQSHSLM